MIKNKDIQAIVFDQRGANPYLAKWLERFEHVRFTSKASPDQFNSLDMVACKRNREIKWFLGETKLPWLLLMDDDVVPLDGLAGCPDTWPLIECQADVASARFVSKAGNEAHGRNGDVAMATLKISRTALRKMKPPWTHFEFNEDETEKTCCECDYFANKARDAGFFPVKAGAVGHVVTAVVVPIPDKAKEEMCRIKLLSQLGKKPKKPSAMPKGLIIPGKKK